jgi:hypothetical protein
VGNPEKFTAALTTVTRGAKSVSVESSQKYQSCTTIVGLSATILM